MFKRILQLSFGFVIAIAMSGALNVHAADDTRTATTQASISLKAGGNITLDSAPDYDFGSQTIDANGTTEKTLNIRDNPSEVLQVTNPGLASGWTVTVQLAPFILVGGTRQLKGATLDLSKNSEFAGTGTGFENSNHAAGVATTSNNTSDLGDPEQPNDVTRTVSHPANTRPLAKSWNIVAGGDAYDMFEAYANQGVGIWQTAFDAGLKIPAGNVEGSYKADLTWTLTNAPTN